DAVHDLGDSLAIGLSWLLDRKAKQKPDKRFTYGYGRYSLLGAMISSLILVAGATFVIVKAIPRLIDPQPVEAGWMLIFAVVGVTVNGIAAWQTAKGATASEKAVSLHLFEDVFGWIAVLLGALAMVLWNIPVLDAILSLVFTVYILFHVFKNIRGIMAVFLEQAPPGIDLETIKAAITDGKDILDVHHLHVWTVDGKTPLATMHVVIADGFSADAITAIRARIHDNLDKIGIHHATIECEPRSAVCDEFECLPENDSASVHHH
ncbi:MAG: cation diffusion facilitator family transporter, partial [bacterium]